MAISFVFVVSASAIVLAATSSCAGEERASAAAPASAPVSHAVTPAGPAGGGIHRTLLQRRPATDTPGWETRLYLIEYAPGVSAPPHAHPAVGLGYVLEGELASAFDGEPVTVVRAGQTFVDPSKATHRMFRNTSSVTPLRFVVAYTIRAEDEPLYPVPSL